MPVDLNADVGESAVGADDELLTLVTSANIACGVHAGNPETMRDTLCAAAKCGVALGAHPGFADRSGFGRREVAVAHGEIFELVRNQIDALATIARSEGLVLRHVKPHGALYNMGARDIGIAQAIARAVASYDSTLVLFGLAGSELVAAGRRAGLRVAAEGFADRSYEPDGSLTPRSEPGALLSSATAAADQALRLARGGTIDTICVHGDTPDAVAIARKIRGALLRAGITVASLA